MIRRSTRTRIFPAVAAVALPLTASASVADAVSTFTYTRNMHPMGYSPRVVPFTGTGSGGVATPASRSDTLIVVSSDRRRVVVVARVALLLLLALTPACGGGESARSLPQGAEPADLDASDFVSEIDNPYWPMVPGSRWVYRETDAEGNAQRVEVTVTERKKTILGIRATVVHDVVTEDGELVEDTYDWYAQDRDGNLWYLGEETAEYENGRVVNRGGSWETGVDGAEAGVIVPADPEVGMRYRQEHYAGEAEDRGEVLSLDEQARVPFGSFDGLLMTKDTTPLEPAVLEHKFYARGIGPILVLDVAHGGREVLISFEAATG
jgi:hypothetical protein